MLVLQQLITALQMGSIYALVALGYTMVYGIIKLINFAHGDFIMVGGYVLFFTMPLFLNIGLPAYLAVILAILACTVTGILVELIAYRPIRKKGTGMSALITAIAMSLFLENLAQAFFSSKKQMMGWSFYGSFTGLKIGDLIINANAVVTVGICVVVMIGLTLFVNKTKMGRAMRAVSEDRTAAVVTGVNINRTILMTFGIGSALAALAALSYCNNNMGVTPDIGATLGLYAFVAAVLGGIGSIPGALIGGFTIGFVEMLANSNLFDLLPGLSGYKDAIVYLVLIVVLLVKPAGILGKNVGEKV